MIGYYTVVEGQRVAVWDRGGRHELVDGPRRMLLVGRRVEYLKAFAAGPTQYLVIRYRDGRTVHQRGPGLVWMDPAEHEEIKVAGAISLDANEALVVYRQEEGREEGDRPITRRIVRGPALFVPEAREWMHEFSWHGATAANPSKKVPHVLRLRSCG